MPYKPLGAYCKEFVTSDPTTGAAANATGTPVAVANHNGTDDGAFALAVNNIDVGRYKITGTIPSGYAKGDVLNVSVPATVGGVAGKAVVDTQIIDSKNVGDLNDAAALVDYQQRGVAVTLPPAPTDWINANSISTNAIAEIQSGLSTYAGDDTAGITMLLQRIPGIVQPQTGDAFGRVGTAGAGLTNLGDIRIAHLNADVTSRMGSYTQPTGFLVATFPSAVSSYAGGPVASVSAPVNVNLAQTITDSQAATVGGALAGAWATAWGKVVKNVAALTLGIWGPGNTSGTPSKQFALDDGADPAQRT